MIETLPARAVRTATVRMPDRAVVPLLLAAITLVGWARLPWAARKVVWAEDGALFLTELEKFGFWPTLFKPYTGYLQFWPRVLTELAAGTGHLGLFADLISFLSCLAVGALGAGVYVWSRSVTADRRLRAAFAVLPVLVPMAPMEVLGNVANLHWFVIWACAFLLLELPRTWRGAAALAVLAATFALTELQVAVLLPLLLVHRGSRKAWAVRAGWSLGLVAQGVSALLAPRVTVPDHMNSESIAVGYFVNGPLAVLVGDTGTAGGLLARFGPGLAVASALPFIMCAAVALVRGSRHVRLLTATLLAASAALWFAAVWVNVSADMGPLFDYAHFTPGQFRNVSTFRYGFVPGLCLLGVVVLAVVALLTPASPKRPASRWADALRRARPVALVGVPTLLAAVLLASFTTATTQRSGQPLWAPSVEAARAVCAAHPRLGTAQVAQAPAGWASDLPCSALTR